MEIKKNSGIAHFMEHILVQGTPSFPTSEELAEYVEGLAGSYGATTSDLGIYFDIHFPKGYLEAALGVASEVFFAPLFDKEAIEKEKGVVLNEIGLKKDSVNFELNHFFREKRFLPGSPLGLSTVGEPEVIKNITRADIVSFWKKLFVPNNAYLVVVGNFSESDLKRLSNKYLGNLKKKPYRKFPKFGRDQFSKERVAVRNDPKLSQVYLDITFPGVGMQKDYILGVKENFYLSPLGNLRNSRLHKILRNQMRLVYGIHSYRAYVPGIGYVGVSTEVDPSNFIESLKTILKVLKKYLSEGPSKEEIAFSKSYITNQWQMYFDSPGQIVSWITGGLIDMNEQVFLPEHYIRVIKKWSQKEFSELASDYWDLGNIQITAQGPFKDEKNIEYQIKTLLEESGLTEPS